MKKLFLYFFMSLFLMSFVFATDRFVATTGADALDCSNPVSPCKTIQYAIGQSNPSGDIINVAAGSYGETVTVDKSLTITGTGTPSTTKFILIQKPVTITGFNVNTIDVSGSGKIQDAINAISVGGTVNVLAGTYIETGQIVINKDLSIVGAGKDITIIKPFQDTGSSGDARGWFLVNSGITFNLKDVTLDGIGYKMWQGIRHKGVGTIENCIFKNIEYESSGPNYAGTAISAFDVAGRIDIKNCEFSKIGRVGVLYYGTGKTGTYSGNTYSGKGIGNWLDYGVEVGGGAHATIINNIISNNKGVASVDGSTSAGILVTTYYGAGTQATITNNNILGNTDGIAVGYDASDTSTVVANYNNISGNSAHGVISTAPSVNAENNWWGACDGPGLVGLGSGDHVTTHVNFNPWIGTCVIKESYDPICVLPSNNVKLMTKIKSLVCNGTVNISVKIGNNAWIDYTNVQKDLSSGNYTFILNKSMINSKNLVKWRYAVDDCYGHSDVKDGQDFEVLSPTTLTINPLNPEASGWYKVEPQFTLTSPNATIIWYRWDSTGLLNYSGGPFKLEKAPNNANITGGTLLLTYWSNVCGNESNQEKQVKVDLANPQIKQLIPANKTSVFNNLKPTISAYLDDPYRNSGIDISSIIMRVNGNPVTPSAIPVGEDADLSYTPTTNLLEGINTVYLKVSDNVGREGETSWIFNIMTTATFTMTVTNPENKTYGERSVPITVTLSGNVKTLEYKDNFDKVPKFKSLCRDCSSYDKKLNFEDGIHGVTIKATDVFGFSREERFKFEVDSKKPAIIKIVPSKGYTNGTFLVKYTEDNLNAVKLFYKGTGESTWKEKVLTGCLPGKNKLCSADIKSDLLSYNDNEIEYYFNVSDFVREIQSKINTVLVDTIDPVITIIEPELLKTYIPKEVSFNVDLDKKVKTFEYSLDGGDIKRLCNNCDSYDKNMRLKLDNGLHTVTFKATDYAGNNKQESREFNILIPV